MKLLKYKRLVVILISLGLIFALGVMTSVAQEKWKVISYTSNIQFIPVPDEEGHMVAAFERRGAAIFEGGEMAAWLAVGTIDWTKGQGPGWGWVHDKFMGKYSSRDSILPEIFPAIA